MNESMHAFCWKQNYYLGSKSAFICQYHVYCEDCTMSLLMAATTVNHDNQVSKDSQSYDDQHKQIARACSPSKKVLIN